MGMVARKVVEKAALLYSKATAHDLFHLNQVGVGCSNGTDKIIHSMKLITQLVSSFTLVKNDCKEVQLANRSITLQQISVHTPGLLSMSQALMDHTSTLWYVGCEQGIQGITSAEGVSL